MKFGIGLSRLLDLWTILHCSTSLRPMAIYVGNASLAHSVHAAMSTTRNSTTIKSVLLTVIVLGSRKEKMTTIAFENLINADKILF